MWMRTTRSLYCCQWWSPGLCLILATAAFLSPAATNGNECWRRRRFHGLFAGLEGVRRADQDFDVILFRWNRTVAIETGLTEHLSLDVPEYLYDLGPGSRPLADHFTGHWDVFNRTADKRPLLRAFFGRAAFNLLPRTRLLVFEDDEVQVGLLSGVYPSREAIFGRDGYISTGTDPGFGPRLIIPFLTMMDYDGLESGRLLHTGKILDAAAFGCPKSFCFSTSVDAIAEWISRDATTVLGHDLLVGRKSYRKASNHPTDFLAADETVRSAVSGLDRYGSVSVISVFLSGTLCRVYFTEREVIITSKSSSSSSRPESGQEPNSAGGGGGGQWETERPLAVIRGQEFMGGQLECYTGADEEILAGCLAWYDPARSILHTMDPRGDEVQRFFLGDLSLDGAGQGRPWRWARLIPLTFSLHFRDIPFRRYWPADVVLLSYARSRTMHIFRDQLVWVAREEAAAAAAAPYTVPPDLEGPYLAWDYFFNGNTAEGRSGCGYTAAEANGLMDFMIQFHRPRERLEEMIIQLPDFEAALTVNMTVRQVNYPEVRRRLSRYDTLSNAVSLRPDQHTPRDPPPEDRLRDAFQPPVRSTPRSPYESEDEAARRELRERAILSGLLGMIFGLLATGLTSWLWFLLFIKWLPHYLPSQRSSTAAAAAALPVSSMIASTSVLRARPDEWFRHEPASVIQLSLVPAAHNTMVVLMVSSVIMEIFGLAFIYSALSVRPRET